MSGKKKFILSHVFYKIVDYICMLKNDIQMIAKCSFGYFIFIIILSVNNVITPFIVAYLTKRFINVIELRNSLFSYNINTSLFILVVAIIVVNVLTKILNEILKIISYKATERMDDSIQKTITKKIREIEYSHFDNPDFIDNLYKASDYTTEVLKNNLMIVVNTISTIISISVMVSILVKYSITIVIITVTSCIFTTGLNLYWEKKKINFYNENITLNRKIDYFEGCMRDPMVIREYRVFNTMDFIKEKYISYWDDYIKKVKDNQKRNLVVDILNVCISSIAYSVSYLIAGFLVFAHKILLNDFVYLITLLQNFSSSLVSMLSILPQCHKNSEIASNYNHILNISSKNVDSHKTNINEQQNVEIEFRHVSFRYPNTERYVLKNISFIIENATLVGIVGRNGAGKSTIVKLILGLYEPTEGDIYFNGQSTKTMKYNDILSKIGVIFQDYAKYATTVKENIYLGNTYMPINMKKIIHSANVSGVTDFVQKFNRKWDQELTKKLTEEGIELSGGQWQRLSLAKTFYKDAQLIILDEPAATLDANVEYEIFKSINQIEHTRILISHRLGNLIKAKKIIVIDNGCLIEMGTHNELIELNGVYAKMFSMQSKNYE